MRVRLELIITLNVLMQSFHIDQPNSSLGELYTITISSTTGESSVDSRYSLENVPCVVLKDGDENKNYVAHKQSLLIGCVEMPYLGGQVSLSS